MDFTSGNGDGKHHCNQGDAKRAARAEEHHDSFDFLVVRLRRPLAWSGNAGAFTKRAPFFQTRAKPGEPNRLWEPGRPSHSVLFSPTKTENASAEWPHKSS